MPLKKISFNKKLNNNRNTTFNLNLIRKYSFNRFNTNPQTFIFNFNTINNDNSKDITNTYYNYNQSKNLTKSK